jgi:hypothetical protein
VADSGGEVRHYFTLPSAGPWAWADGARTLCWRDGGTLAFREEIERILLRLARESQIVPPFTELLLLLAALRGEPRGTLRADRVASLEAHLAAFGADARAEQARAALAPTLEALEVLGNVQHSFWARLDAFDLVACQLVERSGQARDVAGALQLEAQLARGIAAWTIEAPAPPLTAEDWLHAQLLLARGLERFEPAALTLRAQTSLDVLPPSIDVALDSSDGARELVDALRNDPELAAFAALAREIAALVHIPRPVAERTDLPLGGVSDIANRGSLERLLTSELAHDDLTLAVRIATNEALYTRRESPPKPRTNARCIALDVGIHSWGTPRVFAAAVALGLAAAADGHDRALAWKTRGAGLATVDLSSREGLAELLAALEPEPDPTPAFAKLLESETDGGGSREVFLIASEAVAKSAALRRWLREHAREGLYLVSVGIGGRLCIESWRPRGARKVHDALYDLRELQRPVEKGEARQAPELAFELPLFLQQRPLPLRVARANENSHFCEAVHGDSTALVELNSKGDLVVWDDPREGGRVIDTFPGRIGVRLLAADWSWRAHVIYRHRDERELLWSTVDLASGERSTRTLGEHRAWTAVERIAERIVLLREGEFSVVDDDGDVLRVSAPAPCGVHLNGRYFRSGADIVALDFGDGRASFLPLLSPADSAEEAIAVFDWPEVDGPWVVFRNSDRIMSSATGERIQVQSLRVGQCKSLEVRTWNHKPRVVLNGNVEIVLGARERLSASSPSSPGRHLYMLREARMRAPRSIGCDDAGALHVETRPGVYFAIRLSSASSRRGRICAEAVDRAPPSRVAFEALHGLPYGMRVARSASGDLAFTDKRGFLHLVSRDPEAEQLTVALVHDRPLRVWSSDGWSCGDAPYLMGGATRSDDDALHALQQLAAGFR